jgi:hypothetical protein
MGERRRELAIGVDLRGVALGVVVDRQLRVGRGFLRDVASADRTRDRLGAAAGGSDVVAGGQRSLGEVEAHATPGAGDHPGPLLSHGMREPPAGAE